MAKFFTSFVPAKHVPAPTGNGTEIDWKKKKVKGVDTLVISGVINTYSQIQASRESSDLNYLVKQYQETGDASVFTQRRAEYFDLTKMPKDVFEYQAMIEEAQAKFAELPADLRSKFGNNLYNYISDDSAFDKVRTYMQAELDKKNPYNGFIPSPDYTQNVDDVKKEEKVSE